MPLSPNLAPPAFFDDFNAPDGSLTGRAGWTAVGDAAKAAKIVALGGAARVTSAYNGDAPYGFQLTDAALLAGERNRDVLFEYDFSQEGQGNAEDPAFPNKAGYQQYIVGFTAPDDYELLMPEPIGGGTFEFTLYKFTGSFARINSWRGLPLAGTAEFTVRGNELRLSAGGTVYPPFTLPPPFTQEFADGSGIAFGSRTGMAQTFDPRLITRQWRVQVPSHSVNPVPIFVPRSAPGAGRLLTIDGNYVRTPTQMIYRVRGENGGAVAADWEPLVDAAFANGSWSGKAQLPDGGPWEIEVGLSDAGGLTYVARSGPVAVGPLVLVAGQSNADGLSSGSASVDPANNAPQDYGDDPRVYSHSAATYQVVGGVEGNVVVTPGRWIGDRGADKGSQPCSAALARSLSQRIGLPVGVIGAAKAGATAPEVAPGGAYWQRVPDRLVLAGGMPEVVVFDQGESEGLYASEVTAWAPSFGDFEAGIRALTGRPNLPILLQVTGQRTGATNDAAGILRAQTIRQLQVTREGVVPNVYVSAHRVGTPLQDDVHSNAAGYVESARRHGLSAAARAFGTGHDGRGPLVTGGSRLGAVVTLNVDLNGATSLAGTNLTGWEVSADDFATVLPLSSATVSAGKIVLTLASSLSGPVKVRSHAAPDFDDSSLAVGTYADGTTIPIFPVVVPLTVVPGVVPAADGVPVITGTPKVGSTLGRVPPSWTNASLIVRQWLRNGAAITGATATTYQLVQADLGAQIGYRETGVSADGNETVVSAATVGPVVAANLPSFGTVDAPAERTIVLPRVQDTSSAGSGIPLGAKRADQAFDPSDERDFAIDFTQQLRGDEVIEAMLALLIPSGAALGITIDQAARAPIVDVDGKKVQFRPLCSSAFASNAAYSGSGTPFAVTVRVGTSRGDIVERTVVITGRNQ